MSSFLVKFFYRACQKPAIRALVINALLPSGTWWVKRQEKRILKEGRELSVEEKSWALDIGVKEVDQVRILYTHAVPLPIPNFLKCIAGFLGYPINAIGMAANYGIYMEHNSRNDPSLLVHELVHVVQYERLGGVRAFLKQYLEECLRDGYWDAAMEDEARIAAIPYNRPPEA